MDDPNFYCLCKSTHVLTGARWIGLVGTLGCALGLAASLWSQSIVGVLISLVTAPFHVSLLYAHRQREPRLYLPFLVVNGIQTFINALYILFLLAMLAIMPRFWQRHLALSLGNGLTMKEMRCWTLLMFGVVGLLECALCWFQSVVLQAHKYMCQEQVTLIPPQLSPTFAPNTKKEQSFERESQLA